MLVTPYDGVELFSSWIWITQVDPEFLFSILHRSGVVLLAEYPSSYALRRSLALLFYWTRDQLTFIGECCLQRTAKWRRSIVLAPLPHDEAMPPGINLTNLTSYGHVERCSIGVPAMITFVGLATEHDIVSHCSIYRRKPG